VQIHLALEAGDFNLAVASAQVEFGAFPRHFWSVAAAGEVAAWRLKWVALPFAIIVLWSGARIIRSIKAEPGRFIGLRAARLGFTASALVTLLIASLLGITVPARLRQRQVAINAASYSRAYTFSRAELMYRELHGFIPAPDDLINELKTLPDPDGSIADALQNLDVSGYQPTATVASSATSKGKPLAMRGNAIRSAATNSGPSTDHGGVSFTNFELRLPGEDKVLNTDDDLIAGSLPSLGLELDAVVTAQQARAYKPDLRLFHHAHAVLGVTAREVVHVAASQPLDMAVCRTLGIRAFWVNRRSETAEAQYLPFTEVTDLGQVVRQLPTSSASQEGP